MLRNLVSSLLVGVIVTLGCGIPPATKTGFASFVAADFVRGPIVERAVYVEPAQVPTLMTHGGVVLGLIRTTPSLYAGQRFSEPTPVIVANEGGTHFSLASTCEVETNRFAPSLAVFVVWRVPADRVAELPGELRPSAVRSGR